MILVLKDYVRIYKIINTLIINEDGDPSKCCIFFAAYGAAIISKHYNLNAKLKSGFAAYNLGKNNTKDDENIDDILIFGEKRGYEFTGEYEKFHCWIEVNDWIIDFMAPALANLLMDKTAIPSKMFQKPLDKMSESIEKLKNQGDFYLKPATEKSTTEHIKVLSNSLAYKDLENISVQWFQKYPKDISQSIGLGDQNGELKTLNLQGNIITGVW